VPLWHALLGSKETWNIRWTKVRSQWYILRDVTCCMHQDSKCAIIWGIVYMHMEPSSPINSYLVWFKFFFGKGCSALILQSVCISSFGVVFSAYRPNKLWYVQLKGSPHTSFSPFSWQSSELLVDHRPRLAAAPTDHRRAYFLPLFYSRLEVDPGRPGTQTPVSLTWTPAGRALRVRVRSLASPKQRPVSR
jgi:hypothetical protein